MKKNYNVLKALLIFVLFISLSLAGSAQTPPPPPPNTGHGQGGNQAPSDGGAPIGDGMFILIGLAGLYAGKKVYDYKKAVPAE